MLDRQPSRTPSALWNSFATHLLEASIIGPLGVVSPLDRWTGLLC